MLTKLIALTALAAGVCASITADLPAGSLFEVPPDEAEALLTQGVAKLAAAPMAPPAKTKTVKARVLVACAHGQPDDVVALDADIAKNAEAAGQVDTNKAAVAYALTLDKNKA